MHPSHAAGRAGPVPLTAEQRELAAAHLLLRNRLAYRWRRTCPDLSLEDLVSAAGLALCRAAQSWDPAAGSFAHWCVEKMRGEVAALRELARPAGFKNRARDPIYPRSVTADPEWVAREIDRRRAWTPADPDL